MIIKRTAVRGLILDQENQILLIRGQEPGSRRIFWHVPGGGVEPTEALRAALSRELHEELGLMHAPIGAELWEISCTFGWNENQIDQIERYFLVRVKNFTPSAENIPSPEEQTATLEFRWWKLSEIEASPETFFPENLAARLKEFLAAN